MDSNYFFRHAIHKYDYRNKSIQVLEDMSMNSRDPLSAFFLYSILPSQYIFDEIFIPLYAEILLSSTYILTYKYKRNQF